MSNIPLDDTLRKGVESGIVPGVVALVADDREFLYEGAFGTRAQDAEAPMSVDTVFFLASQTKAITAAAALQLVEQGRIELDAPVKGVLPELASPQVLEGYDSDGNPRLRPAVGDITLRQLLSHTAGFAYDIFDVDMERYYQHAGIPNITEGKKRTLDTPLVADPGKGWAYGINIEWVGQLIERISGQVIGDHLRENVFEPLGMRDTSFVLSPAQRERLAGVHVRNEDGSTAPFPFEMPQEPEFFIAGGGLYGTGRDYVTFLQMVLRNGRTAEGRVFLKPETVELMTTNQIGDLLVTPFQAGIPAYTNPVEFFPGMDKKWTLAFMQTTEGTTTGRNPGSLWWAGLANSYFWIDPTANLVGQLLTQVIPFADDRVMGLFADFETSVYGNLGR